jgi:HK97 gp10 family phage protein
MKLEVKGLNVLTKKFDKLSKDLQNDINSALQAWADDVATDAKMLVPVDEGVLKNSISSQYGNGYASVTVASEYGAYIEFGTRKFAANYVNSLPSDWSSYASTFKGTTGRTFAEMVKSIMGWCKRKGIDENAAYPIAKSILINGIRPRPYLYPSVNKNTPQLMEDLKDIIKL